MVGYLVLLLTVLLVCLAFGGGFAPIVFTCLFVLCCHLRVLVLFGCGCGCRSVVFWFTGWFGTVALLVGCAVSVVWIRVVGLGLVISVVAWGGGRVICWMFGLRYGLLGGDFWVGCGSS